MTLTLYNTLTRRKEPFRPIDPSQRAHVCVRADGLRLRAHRQRPHGHRVRRAVPAAAPHLRSGARHLCAQHHRRRRQDQRAGGASPERADPRADRATRRGSTRRTSRRSACLPPTVEPRATEHIAGDDSALIETLVANGPCLCGREPRALRRAIDARLRPLLQPLARGDGGGRARRCGALQEGPDGLRAVEALQARRAVVALAVRHQHAGPARLAHRVLGHGGEALWARCSTSTAAASISSFRTTRTRSPSRAARTARR